MGYLNSVLRAACSNCGHRFLGVAVTAESPAPWRCEERTGKRTARKTAGGWGGKLISSNNRKKREDQRNGAASERRPFNSGNDIIALNPFRRPYCLLSYLKIISARSARANASTREMNLPSKGPGQFRDAPGKREEREEENTRDRLPGSRARFTSRYREWA